MVRQYFNLVFLGLFLLSCAKNLSNDEGSNSTQNTILETLNPGETQVSVYRSSVFHQHIDGLYQAPTEFDLKIPSSITIQTGSSLNGKVKLIINDKSLTDKVVCTYTANWNYQSYSFYSCSEGMDEIESFSQIYTVNSNENIRLIVESGTPQNNKHSVNAVIENLDQGSYFEIKAQKVFDQVEKRKSLFELSRQAEFRIPSQVEILSGDAAQTSTILTIYDDIRFVSYFCFYQGRQGLDNFVNFESCYFGDNSPTHLIPGDRITLPANSLFELDIEETNDSVPVEAWLELDLR